MLRNARSKARVQATLSIASTLRTTCPGANLLGSRQNEGVTTSKNERRSLLFRSKLSWGNLINALSNQDFAFDRSDEDSY